MKKTLLAVVSIVLLGSASMANAAGDYNDVPSSDPQFQQCISYANKNYTGGNEASPIPGQTKVAAFCECMWNETSDNFRGNLAKFAETERGQ
ncbi:MAG: hypothetical protein HQL94_04650, partial [Magnetococcales bacterium]|nr:hypothetical protein [Magnetococcales bacterium]